MNTANESGSDVVYDGQAEIKHAGTQRRDSITGATVPVHEEPKFDLTTRTFPAASTAVANGNTGILSAAESAPASPLRESGVKALDTTDQAASTILAARPFTAASTAAADVNAAAVTAVETGQASPASEDDGELEDFDGSIAADYYAPIPNNGYLWYPNYNPMAEPYDPRKPSFDDMIPQQEAYDDMLGTKSRGTLTKPKDLVNRLICKECKVDPPTIVEHEHEADLVCGDCGLVLMGRSVYLP